MRRRPPRSTLTDTLFPTRRSSDVVAIVGNLDAGHALERGGGGGIGQLADILRDARIDHLDRILLDLGGAFQRRADAGDDDGVLSRLVRQSGLRSDEQTSDTQSLMRISYAVFCLKNKTKHK